MISSTYTSRYLFLKQNMILQTKHVTNVVTKKPPGYISPNNSHHESNKNSPSHNTMYLTKTPPPSSTCFNQSHPSTPVLSMQSKDNSRCRVAATGLGCVPTANASPLRHQSCADLHMHPSSNHSLPDTILR